jgi:hypothetical protein
VGEQRRVLLYGNSVILGCIGASLKKISRFEVVLLAPPLPGSEELEALEPDVILFDAENGRPEAALSLLSLPDLIVLGISLDGNVVRRWSSREYHELSTGDLAVLIEGGSPTVAFPDDRLGDPG